MKETSTELKVGIFAIAVIAFLSYMTFKVGSLPMIWEKGYRLYVEFEDTKGLDEQSRVKIAGVDVGIVEKIELVKGRARLTLLMDPNIELYKDAKAFLRMSGLLGDRYLALSTGTPGQMVLNDGDIITDAVQAADIDALATELASAATHIGELTKNFNRVFGEDQRKSIRESIDNIKTLTENLIKISDENREPLRRIVAQLESFTNSLQEKGPGVLDDMGKIAKSWGDEGPVLIENLNRAATELRETVGDNKEAFKESMDNIKTASKSASVIAQKLESGEGTLGRLLNDESLFESIQKVSSEAEKSLDVVGRLRTYVDFSSEYNTGDADWKGYLNLKLQPREDRYYILGLVTDPMGSVVKTERVRNGVLTIEEEVEDKIEFSAQFGRRFEDYALRIGLLENTFGVGADYFFDDDRGRVKLDMWDFSAKEVDARRVHAKIGIDYRIFKILFVSGGVDNILNSERRGIYLGGGIMFEDEDLKYLLGKMPGVSIQ